MLVYRLALAAILALTLVSCDQQQQTVSVSFEECDQGLSRKQINDLITILSEFEVASQQDEQRFFRKLGGPVYPLISPGCYGVTYTDVLAAIIPRRMVSFNVKPFEMDPAERHVKNIYRALVNDFALATMGEWKPNGVDVAYRDSKGLVTIKFNSFEKTYRWRVDQHEAIDRVGDEFFDNLMRLEVERLSGMFYNMSKGKDAYYAYLPKKLVPELRRLGVK